ncbi:MAG: hypothetical protein WBP47_22570, partial [Candidatus Promineifilaceae bacterium]
MYHTSEAVNPLSLVAAVSLPRALENTRKGYRGTMSNGRSPILVFGYPCSAGLSAASPPESR